MIERVALGTVQFGLPYGVANQTGQVSRDETAAILDCAWSAGVDTLDTAAAYGEAEERLGKAGTARWRVVTKLPPSLPESCDDVAGWVEASVVASLERLQTARVYALLVHSTQQLTGQHGRSLWSALESIKSCGLVDKIGMSIYGPEDLDVLWDDFRPDLVQAPFNVLDRRLESSGWLARLHRHGTEVHVRSIFLQGLLLMNPVRRPAAFGRWDDHWQRWERWLKEQSLTPVRACVGFVSSRPEVGRMVVGVDRLEQLDEILDAARVGGVDAPVELICEDRDLVDPSRWRLGE